MRELPLRHTVFGILMLLAPASSSEPAYSVRLTHSTSFYSAPDVSDDPLLFTGGTIAVVLGDTHWRAFAGAGGSTLIGDSRLEVTHLAGNLFMSTGYNNDAYSFLGVGLHQDRLSINSRYVEADSNYANLTGISWSAGVGKAIGSTGYDAEASIRFQRPTVDSQERFPHGVSLIALDLALIGPFWFR